MATCLCVRQLDQAVPPLEEPGEIVWIAAKWRDPRVLIRAFKYQIGPLGQRRARPACHWMTSYDVHVSSMGEIPRLLCLRKVLRPAHRNRARLEPSRGRSDLFASQALEETIAMTATATSIAT